MSNVISTLIWVGFLSGVLYFFQRDLRGLLDALLGRLRQGASVKFGSIEVGAVNALPSAMEKTEQARVWRSDDDGRRQAERSAYYEQTRRVMLVHKLFPATEPGELYDILIYVIPSKDGTLAAVQRVEYFFGGYGWKNRVFTASDRSRGFPILTAAYGPFLCTAELFFTDGNSVMLHRYIDFEMGNVVSGRAVAG